MALTAKQLKELKAAPAGEAGNRVAVALRLAGLTQVQMAAEIGESQPAVSDIVRGRYGDTSLTKARKFAEFFGCAIEDLFPAPEAKAS